MRAHTPLMFQMNEDRFSLFPIGDAELWEIYKRSVASFWTTEEVDLSNDQWDSMTPDEQRYIKTVLSFFAWGDGVVNENLVENFSSEVQLPEARCFWGFQIAMENIHNEMYSLCIDTYIKDGAEKLALFNSMRTHPTSREKGEWAMAWMRSDRPLAERLVAFSCLEGIMFSGAFCSIYYLKKRGLHLPGLTFSNELISRDEGMHCDFACLMHRRLWPRGRPIPAAEADRLLARRPAPATPPPRADADIATGTDAEIDVSVRRAYAAAGGKDVVDDIAASFRASMQCDPATIHRIVADAVDIECRFVTELLPVSLIGMNATLMKTYIQFVADRLCFALDVAPIYGAECPFDWMELISLQGKTNFFERRVGEYQKSGVLAALQNGGSEPRTFTMDEDF